MFIISLIFQAFNKMEQPHVPAPSPAHVHNTILIRFVLAILSNLFASHMKVDFNAFNYKDKYFPDGIFVKIVVQTQKSIDALYKEMCDIEGTCKFFHLMEPSINTNINVCLVKIVSAVNDALKKGNYKSTTPIYAEICRVSGEFIHPHYKLGVDAIFINVVREAIDDLINSVEL